MDVHPTKNVSIGIDPYPYQWVAISPTSTSFEAFHQMYALHRVCFAGKAGVFSLEIILIQCPPVISWLTKAPGTIVIRCYKML